MKSKIIWRFLGVYILLVFVAIFVLNFFVSMKLRDYYEQKISERLSNSTILVADIIKKDLLEGNREVIQTKTEELAAKLDLRVTVLDGKGEVLGDSEKDPALMEDHSNRLEVLRAIQNNFGESNRFSDTLGYNMKYVAMAVKENGELIGVVRLAVPLAEVESQIRFIYKIVLLGGGIAAVFALILGFFSSRGIINSITQMKEIAQNITEGDFSKRVNIKGDDELAILAKSLNKMADELQLKIDNLERLNKVRTDFVANVSHELKTPLTSIKGFIETLEDGALEDKENAKRFISIIKKHAQGLTNIVDDLLSLSELELGKDRLQKTKIDLKELIDEVILGFGHSLSMKNQKLDFSFKGKDFKIVADRQKLEQVLVNLIDNALKYTAQSGLIKVSISQEENSLLVVVEDNGIGIPKEHLDRIFERFYRVDKARSRQMAGTGLGLAIVKHIIALHNGDISIDSQPNKGTKVKISLPKA